MLVHKLIPLFALALNLLLLGSAVAPDRRSHRNLVFAYLAGGLAVWNLGVFGLRSTTSPDIAAVWEHLLHVGVIPIPVLFYHYVLVFLDRPRRRALFVGYGLAAAFLAVSPTATFMTGVRETPWGFVPAAGPLYGPFFVYFQSYLGLGLVGLLRDYRGQTSSFKRNRTLLVIAGALVSLTGGAVDFLRFIAGAEWLYPVGIPFNALFALALGVAIVRYRLMSVGALVKRLVLYLCTSAALAPLLFLGLWGVDQLLLRRHDADVPAVGDGAALAGDWLILLLIFTIALPLLRRLEQVLERLMFRREHGVRDALVALSRELPVVLDADALGRTLTAGLVERIPAVHAAFYLRDAAGGHFTRSWSAASELGDESPPPPDELLVQWLRVSGRPLVVEEAALHPAAGARLREALARLERGRVALLVPLVAEGELAAVLLLGDKLSGEIYDGGEIELLETLLGQTAIALKNATLYEDLRVQMHELRCTQEQLVQSAKLAAIGELAASIAHELNNPLMVILGSSGLLLKEVAADTPAAGRATAIVTEANRAGKIVRDLLDFARRREPDRQPLALHELIERALGLLQAKLDRSRIDVQRVFDPALPIVRGDRDQLTQVFINLITNAADAMEEGGLLTLETGVRPDDGRSVVVASVVDSGPGIAPEQLGRIFEPFYTTKAEGRGTGLGLSVSQNIVRMHGGTIEADSKLRLGTAMRVILPLD